MWSDDWIGLPYRIGGRGPEYDCLGLWLALRKSRGLSVPPDPQCDQREALRGKHIKRLRPFFLPVIEGREGDLIMFRHSSRALHVGFAIDDRDMIHIESDAGMSRIEDYRSTKWRSVLAGIYRYAC